MNSVVTSVSCSRQINLSLCRGWLFNIVLGLKLHQVRFMLSMSELGEEQTKSELKGIWFESITFLMEFASWRFPSVLLSEVVHEKFHKFELLNTDLIIIPKKKKKITLRNHFVHSPHHYRQFSKTAKRIINIKPSSLRNHSLWQQGKYNFLRDQTWNRSIDEISDDSHNTFTSFQFYVLDENIQCHHSLESVLTCLLNFKINLVQIEVKKWSRTRYIPSSWDFLCADPGNSNNPLVLANEMFTNVPLVPPLMAHN